MRSISWLGRTAENLSGEASRSFLAISRSASFILAAYFGNGKSEEIDLNVNWKSEESFAIYWASKLRGVYEALPTSGVRSRLCRKADRASLVLRHGAPIKIPAINLGRRAEDRG